MSYELKSGVSWTALIICALGTNVAWASDLDAMAGQPERPAVSELNAKFAVVGGVFEEFGAGLVEGSVSIPVTFSTGLQLDGLVGIGDGGGIFGGGAHLFWRDPSVGLFGIYASVTDVNVDSSDYTHFSGGLEAAAYVGRFSIEAIVGLEGGDNTEAGVFAFANLAYYPLDDLRLYAGARYIQEDVVGAAGLEYQFNPGGRDQAIAVFAEGRIGEDRAEVWGGMRVYFGQPNSLIGRHREDDPSNPSLDFLFEEKVDGTVAGCGLCET